MSRLRFSPAVANYLERHAIDPNLAHELGVRSDRDTLVYPFTTKDGRTFRRRRDLDDPQRRTKQPSGEPLVPWWPAGRPEPGEDVLICEGEPDALAALSALNGRALKVAALPGTTTPPATVALEVATAGRVYMAPDGDGPGRAAADKLARALQSHVELYLIRLEDGQDLADKLAAAEDASAWFAEALEQAPRVPKLRIEPSEGGAGGYAGGPPARQHTEKASQATRLVAIATASAELFRSPDGTAFATVTVESHRETWPVRSKRFKSWLARRFYGEDRKAPGAQALQDALGVLEGQSLFEGQELPVAIRIAEAAGSLYLDLGDPTWRAVEIDTTGWRLVAEPPVRLRRPAAHGALPEPVRGGSVSELRRFVNVEADADWTLIVGWLLAALRPTGPYPALVLHGEHGAAKSTTARLLRALIDPNAAPLRAEPREPRDLMISASNGWVVALDNLSRLQPWLSDGLCRLATGGGFAVRELYSDTDEVILEAQRPAILTGIEELATRGDLLDRSLVVYLPAIAEQKRLPERALWQEFERARPRILGALLDAAAAALERLPEVALPASPRMADFAEWVVAAEPILGWPEGTFLAAYSANRGAANELTLDASLIAPLLRELADGADNADGEFEGTATDLLTRLGELADEGTTRRKSWPATPQALGAELRRIAPNLRAVGVEVSFDREGKSRRRTIAVRKRTQTAVRPVRPVRPGGEEGQTADNADGADNDSHTQSVEPPSAVKGWTAEAADEFVERAKLAFPGSYELPVEDAA